MTDGAIGVRSSVAPLRRVAMRRPGAILGADPDRWHYASPIDPDRLTAQYDAFARLVASAGAEIDWLPDDHDDDLADSVFTYDPSFVVGRGVVVLRPGKALRRGEAALHKRFYQGRVPVLGTIEAPGVFEGGDCFWLDADTLAVGRGFRTNQAGIEQFRAVVEPLGIAVEVYDLPYLHGPEACLHLLSVVSPLADDLALVHAPLLPTALHQRMEELGYRLLHAPHEEFEASLGLNLNVLALAPRRVLTIDGFDETTAIMRAAGCEVTTFPGDALCIPCEGGPTCLTRPLHRA
ncbi:MAG: arginine deiminase family protein [Actinomycetota bacterium]